MPPFEHAHTVYRRSQARGPRTGRSLTAEPAAEENEAPLPALRGVLLGPGIVPQQQVDTAPQQVISRS